MAILLNDNLKIAAAKPVDNRYGPYLNTSEALTAIPAYQRYAGLVVGIQESGNVTEYWFEAGVADNNLVPKTLNEWQVISSNSSVTDNSWILADSSSAGFTLTLSASPEVGAYVWIQDAKGSWQTNNVIVDPGGNQIVGLSDSLSLNVANSIVLLTYVGGDVGWDVKNVAGDFSDEFTILTPLTTAAISVGSSTQCASLTIDQYGRVVSASNNSITPQGIGAFSTADIISITQGGTGSTSAAAALTALGAQAALTSASPLGISQGGTGAITTNDVRSTFGGIIPVIVRHNSVLVLASVGTLTNAQWTFNSPIVTFTSTNVTLVPGMSINATGLTTAVIKTVDSATQITMSSNATGGGGPGSITVFNSSTTTLVSSSVVTMDGRTLQVSDLILLTAQTATAQNGPWQVTNISTGFTLTRPSWFTGTLTAPMVFGVQQGTANSGFTVVVAGSQTAASTNIGIDALAANTLSNRSTIVTTNNTTPFSARQTFTAGTANTNPFSFQASTTQLSTLVAHAVEWDSNLMYMTPLASAGNLKRSINASYIPALTSADILTIGSAQSTVQLSAITTGSPGVLGQTILDSVNDILYICTATNKWRRVQLSNF